MKAVQQQINNHDVFFFSPARAQEPAQGSSGAFSGPPVQLSGRTSGDLITFFNSPLGIDPRDLVGTIQTVHVHESGVLSLSGMLQSQLPGTLATT